MASWDSGNTLWKQGLQRARLRLPCSEVLSYTPYEAMSAVEEEEVTSKYRPHFEIGESSTCPAVVGSPNWFDDYDDDDDDDDMPGLNFTCYGEGCGCDICLWDFSNSKHVKDRPDTPALDPSENKPEAVEPVEDSPASTSSHEKAASNRGSASMTV